jgi:hypothetical protein
LFTGSDAPGSASVEDKSMMDADGVILRAEGLIRRLGTQIRDKADRVIFCFEDLD